MKVINSNKCDKNKCDNIEMFFDNNGEYTGFSGTVSIYDSSVFIDTRNGLGYDVAIKKLKPLINRLMNKFRFNGNSTQDTKHDIIVHILEGLSKYNPTKNTKLSTFLEMRIDRRLINELRDGSRMCKNATFLNISAYHVICKCGNDFVATISNSEIKNTVCPECEESILGAKKCVSVPTPELLSGNGAFYKQLDSYNLECLDVSPSNNSVVMFKNEKATDDEAIFRHDMQKFLESADPRVIKIFELMYFHDYSIKAAAEHIGLSGVWANITLKKLQNNNEIRELFDRLNK